MKDIEIAKKLLIDENQALVVVKNGEVIYKSVEKGIKPMYILSTEMKSEAKGASLADKVIGRGAALLCGYVEIKEVYTDLISEGGIAALGEYNIPYEMEKSCQYIMNKDKTSYCPIEKLSLDTDDPALLLQSIKEFFASFKK
ncbi:DUF1893 domain-containing protein [Tissierella sp.]|uniref:DUF1893 domain-containing protein n=1 Tax=Tissierella sp. TaxID=41274 RepID=UPI002854EFC8|nr:DUF1893 domain-containing protein [Tissierella sp.]MDR7856545.1 DUF1893 domain-containing protein [Tissierella sp.]